jgi:glucokinase
MSNEPEEEADPKPPQQANVVLAVDITAERFEAALVTAAGTLVDRASVLVERDVGPESHYTNLAGVVTEMLTVAEERHGVNVVGVGVGSAGPVGRHLEMVSPAGLISWRDFPLRARLVELTGLAVHGDFDAKVLALAEGWLGAAQGHQNFCTITVSGSVAGGLVLDGDLLDGASGYAGQVGHIIVEPGGRRCVCGAQGCLDAEAAGAAIESITGRPLTEPTYEIMQRTGRLVGRAAATVCNTLDLTLVVVGGTIARNFAATFFHSAQAALEEHAQLPYSRGARITPSRLGENGQLIGAGAFGWRQIRRAQRAASASDRPNGQPPKAR